MKKTCVRHQWEMVDLHTSHPKYWLRYCKICKKKQRQSPSGLWIPENRKK